MSIKYYWRELTDEGLLKPFKANYWDNHEFGWLGYDTEEDAVKDFMKTFGTRVNNVLPKRYLANQYVIVKCYGIDGTEDNETV